MYWFQSCGLKTYLARQHYQSRLEMCLLERVFFPIYPCAHRHKYLCFIKAKSSTELAVAADDSQRTIFNPSYISDNQTSIIRNCLLQQL